MKIGWLLKLFPDSWRQRYADEFLALLEQMPFTPTLTWDVLLCALDARLHPTSSSEGVNERVKRMQTALRAPVLAVITAFGALVVTTFTLGATVDHIPLDITEPAFQALPGHEALLITWNILNIGSKVAFLAALMGIMPVLWSTLNLAIRHNRTDIMRLLFTPFFAFVGLLALMFTLILFLINQKANHLAGWIFGLAIVVAICLSVVCLCQAVIRSQVGNNLLHFTLFPAVLTGLAMFVITCSALVWGGIALLAAPAVFGAILIEYLIALGVMGSATFYVATSVRRGLTAWDLPQK